MSTETTQETTTVEQIDIDLDNILGTPGAESIMLPEDKKPSMFSKGNIDTTFLDKPENSDDANSKPSGSFDDVLKDVAVIGPKKDGAQIEGSKDFSKRLMVKYGIPTARYNSFTRSNLEEGYKFLDTLKPPYVLKADGLAAGKGVLILADIAEAKQELKNMLLDAKFGNASSTVVIEELY